MSDIKKDDLEVRNLDKEIRMYGDDEEKRVEGYAAVFNQSTQLGNVEEVVMPGAFEDRLNDDVVALFNHDQNMPLARSRNGEGTLKLEVDEVGLRYSFSLGNQTYARDLAESIKRGDVSGSSFGFVVREDEYERKSDGGYLRKIHKVSRLADISPVLTPAYPQTSVALRDAISAMEEQVDVPEQNTPPTLTPKRNIAEALLSIHHHNLNQ
jgi:HK97 family phage prohead protease